MRPIEVHSVSMSFAPMVARLNSDGSVFFGPLAFGSTCQNARFPTAAMVGISQSPSPSSTSAGLPRAAPSVRAVYMRQTPSRMSASAQMRPEDVARTS